MKDVIVVGGGAAGMMAAIAAAENGNKVTLIERNDKLGKKIFITGKGRCNVTNACDTTEFFNQVTSNPKFLYSSIYGYDHDMVYDFFESNSCPLKIERGERVFPVSDHSSDIIRTLENVLKKKNVKILKNKYVTELTVKEGKITGLKIANTRPSKSGSFVTYEPEKMTESISSDAVILATGGISYRVTGSDGNMFKLLTKVGHTITELRPGLVPLESKDSWISPLSGLSLKNVSLRLMVNNKKIYDGFGEMLFTHFGISGPLVLTGASYLNKKYAGQPCKAIIDLKPALDHDTLDKRILRDFEDNKNKSLKNGISGLLPSKLISVIPLLAAIDEEKKVNEITKEEREKIVHTLKNLEINITGSRDFNEAIITIGGVSTKEINPSTMESKIIKNLFFAGEMIDVDALTGGYNLQIAWSTGHLAGQSVNEV